MNNSELLRIKNKQKTPWKDKRLQAVVKHYIERTNDWFGLHDNVVSISRIYTRKVSPPRYRLLKKRNKGFTIIRFYRHRKNIFCNFAKRTMHTTMIRVTPRNAGSSDENNICRLMIVREDGWKRVGLFFLMIFLI